MKTFILGLGTGRSGTQSLSALLDEQSHASVSHEHFKSQVPWGAQGYDWVDRLLSVWPLDASLFGDVSLYWLPQIERLLLGSLLPENTTLRVVALRRDRDATVQSYMRKTGGETGRNHWMMHDGTSFTRCSLGWDHCYPKFQTDSKRDAITMYWSAYYGEVDRLASLYPDQVRRFDLEEMNTREGQQAILRFVGIPEAEHVLQVGIQKNEMPFHSSEETPGGDSLLASVYRKVRSGLR